MHQPLYKQTKSTYIKHLYNVIMLYYCMTHLTGMFILIVPH